MPKYIKSAESVTIGNLSFRSAHKKNGTNPYNELANAIILDAVKEWKQRIKYGNYASAYGIERQMLSEYFDLLSGNVDMKDVIKKLHEEYNLSDDYYFGSYN